MNEADFNRAAAEILLRVEQAVEHSGADIDFEMANEILTLEFANASKIIINKQGAVRQIWVAAKSGGFHYRFDAAGGQWLNDQSGAELFSELSRLVSAQAGETVSLG